MKNRRLSILIALAAGLNLIVAPVMLAASNGTISRSNAYMLGLLMLVVLGLALYLLAVIVNPERF